MARIEAAALDIDTGFGRFQTEHLTEAWREAHYAAQAAAEVGKSWGEAHADDSHSSFAWFRDADGRGLEGVPAAGKRTYRARLKFEGLELSLGDGHGRTIGDFSLPGHTMAEAMEWIDRIATQELGERAQAAKPAPDLPSHALASGGAFRDDPDGFNDLADLYDATAQLIEKLRAQEGRFGEGRCWPHHFDLATLAEFDGGAKTIGVGLTPPDSVEGAGYWYVSPWAKEGVEGSPSYPALADGRWVDRGDGLKMAVLPVTELSGESERSQRLAGFVAAGVNACMGVLDV